MKRVLVLGATRGTGQQIVAQALDQGHEVTAFVRDPARLHTHHERLHVIHRSLATVSRADLAQFLLNQLDDRTYVRKIVQLGC